MSDERFLAGRRPSMLRPMLRPGLLVVRRDDGHLQIGIDPPHRLIIEDHPDVRRVLDDLRHGRRPDSSTPATHRLLSGLLAHGLLVDAADLDNALATANDRAAAAATFAQFGSEAASRLAARAAARVAVEAPAEIRHSALRLLRAAGTGLATGAEDATVLLMMTLTELPRDRLDAVIRAGRPHLLVAGGSTGMTVGPFVVPGLTACLRCVDAHRGESDPRRAMVVEQCVQEAEKSGGPVPRDPSLVALAVAWAVRDLVSFVDGDQPATWSSSVSIGPSLALERRQWTRHPHCGCSWGEIPAAG